MLFPVTPYGLKAKKGKVKMQTKNFRMLPAGEICEVEVGDDVTIQLFRSAKYVGNCEGLNGFRPAKVLKNSAEVWSFQKSSMPFGAFGELCEYGTRHIIVLRDRHTLYEVVIPSDYEHMATMTVAGKLVTIGGTAPEELLDIKMSAANELGIEYRPSLDEAAIIEARRLEAREKRTTERTQVNEEAEDRRREREERVFAITSRKKVEAWSTEGKHYFGHPVEGDEWMVLSDGAYCIAMEDGSPKLAFIVKKKGSKVSKVNETKVFASVPEKKVDTKVPEAVKVATIKKGDVTWRVPIFRNFADVKTLREQGLNSGTWVGVQPAEGQRLTVYAVHRETIDTVGQFQPSN